MVVTKIWFRSGRPCRGSGSTIASCLIKFVPVQIIQKDLSTMLRYFLILMVLVVQLAGCSPAQLWGLAAVLMALYACFKVVTGVGG